MKIKLVKSLIGRKPNQKATAKALGLTKINKVIEKEDTPQIRGMINVISHMVEVTE